jgi:hypothetical protein
LTSSDAEDVLATVQLQQIKQTYTYFQNVGLNKIDAAETISVSPISHPFCLTSTHSRRSAG